MKRTALTVIGASVLVLVLVIVIVMTARLDAQTPAWPPAQPIKFIVPTSAGGGTDALARLIGQRLQPKIGATFVVENKPGGSGNIGTSIVKNEKPDGATFLFTQAAHTSNVAFFKSRYDPVKDFETVAFVGPTNFVLCVRGDSPIKTFDDLVAHIRTVGDKASFASGGYASSSHLAMELFKSMTGLKMTHVPYKGTTPAVTDLLAGVVDMTVATDHSAKPLVESVKVRCLAATGAGRSTLMPELPTIAEAMPLPGYQLQAWYGILGPANLPRPIIEVMNREVNQILRDPEFVKKHLTPNGITPEPTTPEAFKQQLEAEVARYLKLAKQANIELRN